MSWLNFTHLRCFWATLREGGVSAAARALHVSQPTVSAHLKTLETVVGKPLLDRSRTPAAPTATGKVLFRYADEIFRLEEELGDVVRGRGAVRERSVRLGVAAVLPKSVVHHILEPALADDDSARLVCYAGKPADLLGRLAREELDAVVTDTPLDASYHVNAFNHLLGESTLSVFAPADEARRYRSGFPLSLDGAPFLLPTDGTSMRRELDRWFSSQQIRPDVRGEFEDLALLKHFAADGHGLFALPTVVEREVRERCAARVVARLDEVRERFYVITLKRRVVHDAVKAIVQGARGRLFA